MHGPSHEATEEGEADASAQGLIPRTLQELFLRLAAERAAAQVAGGEFQAQCVCSYLEIYNEGVSDLLAPAAGSASAENLNVREDTKGRVFVEGATQAPVSSAEETVALFTRGAAARRTGGTAANRESSRSHSLFTVSLETRARARGSEAWSRRRAAMHLVDLAGSERQRATEAAGLRLKEASAINKSLSALGNVIHALVDVAKGLERHGAPPPRPPRRLC